MQNTPEAEDDDFEEVPFHDSDSEYDSDEKAEVLAIGTRLVSVFLTCYRILTTN